VVVMDEPESKIFDPGRVIFLLLGSGWGGSATSGFRKFPITHFFKFFSFGSKTGLPLIYCRSKVYSGWVRAHL